MPTGKDQTISSLSASLKGNGLKTLSRIRELDIDHELDVYDARRGLHQQAKALGFGTDQAHYLVTALTELANNIVFHSVGGWVAICQVQEALSEKIMIPRTGIQITACDRGPGIADVKLAIQEGFSTTNSLGCGLSGVSRLMDQLDITTSAQGTCVYATMWARGGV